MNKNLRATALLVAVFCQSASAVPFFTPTIETSMLGKFFGSKNVYRVQALVGVGITVLALAGYKYLTKEKVWPDGDCIKFEKGTLFGKKEGSVRFKNSEEATAAYLIIETGHFFGGFPRIQEAAELQRKSPNHMWFPEAMTDADVEALKFKHEKLILKSMNNKNR